MQFTLQPDILGRILNRKNPQCLQIIYFSLPTVRSERDATHHKHATRNVKF